MNKKLKREIEVAFSKHAQPIWFRLAKYLLIGITFYFFWASSFFWLCFGILSITALLLHFWYRHKTEGWTRSYGMWDYEKNKSNLKD